ncbi:hypothetical protein GCM10011529_00130 [Polymorphobacter glacialis]|uniref:Porin family protein n=1 Tax=Sandarakinorhabdus glacialis TaxID=1614636 RepID=A0A916ZHF4_9SPHN|nr:porin [Polymorphobacter glacialis]GGD98103.1 hypothetical protein GCM10011529_00130 [Polymorphobacter glacialis]
MRKASSALGGAAIILVMAPLATVADARLSRLGMHGGARASITVPTTAKPGTNTPAHYLDTGTFEAAGADYYGLELQYTRRGLSVLAELVSAQVRSEPTANPHFMGFYVIGSWVITGEHRAYNHATGLVRPLVPQGRWGAPELIARYAVVDLDGGSVRGGRYKRVELGINCWATSWWKLGVIGGRIWLDRFGETGVIDSLLTRLQWVY